MKKTITFLFTACIICLFSSCSSATPEEYFSIATLNSNLLYGFAGDGMQSELKNPSVKLIDEKTMATAPMKRAEVVKDKLQFVESSYKKVKGLGSNKEADEMIKASLALYEFVLPVYKNEYTQLAVLYDEAVTAEKIATMEKNISDKYATKFNALYNELHTAGMAYATKHGMKVREVNPAP